MFYFIYVPAPGMLQKHPKLLQNYILAPVILYLGL
jgi:hypothetical protein